MRLKLVGFRCHVDSTYVFQEGSVSLLKGPSGIGKSTIFAATLWVLYGGMQHVYNNANATNKCSVTLELDNPHIIVYRQKRPELLRVTVYEGDSTTSYEDQVAQSVINGMFGTKEVWLACCYIPQGTRSYLLTASNSDKMDLLNILSFNTESPDTYTAKIDTELASVTSAFTHNQTTLTAECEQFSKEIDAANLDMSLYLDIPAREEMSKQVLNEKTQLTELTARYNEEQRQRGVVFSLKETVASLTKQLEGIPIESGEDVPRLESELEVLNVKAASLPYLREYQRLQNERSNVEKSLALLSHVNDNLSEITDDDVSKAQLDKRQYDENSNLCHQLKCAYDEVSINRELQEVSTTIEYYPKVLQYAKQREERAEIQRKLSLLPPFTSPPPDVTEAEIATATLQQQQYESALAQCRSLGCPYSEDEINAEIAKLNRRLAVQPKIATYTKLRNDRNALELQLKEIVAALGDSRIPPELATEEAISEAVVQSSHHEEGKALAASLVVPYDESAITKEIARLSHLVDLQPRLHTLVKYLTLQRQIQSLLSLNHHRMITDEEVISAREALHKLQSALDIRKCPHCERPIRAINGQLLPGESLPPTSEEISNANITLQLLTENRKRTQEIEGLSRELESLRSLCDPDNIGDLASLPAPLSQEEIVKMKGRIASLSKIRVVAAPSHSPNLLRLTRSRLQLEQRHQLIQQEIEALLKEVPGEMLEESMADIPMLQNRVSSLAKIRIVAPPTESPDRLRLMLTYNQLSRRDQELNASLTSLMGEVPIDRLNKPISQIDLPALKNRLASLSKIRVVSPPVYAPELLQSILNKRRLERRRDELEQEIQKLPSLDLLASLDANTISENITRIKKRLSEIAERQTKYKMLSAQIEEMNRKIQDIILDETLADRIAAVSKSIEQHTYQLAMNERIDAFTERQVILEKKRDALEILYKDMTTLTKLKALAREVECHTLQNTVDSINAALSDIATHLFDDPISITLQLFKTLKTSDRVKPTVNINISYRGGEYDNIFQLSGGEGDRISLAITLALARISGCPLLLLDECMASLDANLKEACLKAIKRNLGSEKTVLTINHEGTEGTYDYVVPIGTR